MGKFDPEHSRETRRKKNKPLKFKDRYDEFQDAFQRKQKIDKNKKLKRLSKRARLLAMQWPDA